MAGIFSLAKQLLIYKEPYDQEGFEFLENENEDGAVQQQKAGGGPNIPEQGNMEGGQHKQSITAAKWNETRKAEPEKQTGYDISFVSPKIDISLAHIKQRFSMDKNQDIVVREFKIAGRIKAFILFVEGMIDRITTNDWILRPLMDIGKFNELGSECPLGYIVDNVLPIHQITREKKFDNIAHEVLNGVTALFINGCDEAILIESRGFEKRNIEKPATENIIRGSQEGFTENLRTNLTLIRRIIKNEKLITEILPVGKTNNSCCAVLYLEGVTNPNLISEVKRRIQSIDMDFISTNGMLEEMINDQPLMIFPQIATTERPDRVASFIMDGKVVFIMEGAPFAGSVPTNFFDLMHSPEDYVLRWQFGTFLRFIRLFGIAVSILLPGLYVAMVLFHQDMIPTDLLFSIAKSRENIPFPTIIELVLMEISFELIREAGLRVPGIIGPTLGIIGALILGQAAVAADIVSPVLIIVVAVTGIGSFSIPSYTLGFGVRIARFVFIIFGAIAGFYGISAALAVLTGMLCGMKSFGVPFFTPVAPKTRTKPDVIIEQPLYKQTERVDAVNPLDIKAAGNIPRGWVKRKRGDKK
jgi:spore germination protein KA